MPQTLLTRFSGGDSICSFREAARRRYADGLHAADSGDRERRTVAVYLWGYAVEMTLKAAVYRTLGYSDGQPLVIKFKTVAGIATSYGMTWQGANLHAVDEWARLLVAVRASPPIATPMSAGAASELLRRSGGVARTWAEWVRYHANVAYPYELSRMRDQATWFVSRFDSL